MKDSEKSSSFPASEAPARRKLGHALSTVVSSWLSAPWWRRAAVWLTVALASLWLFLSPECYSILRSISRGTALHYERSYPIIMPALAAIILLLRRTARAGILSGSKAGLELVRSLLLGTLLIITSVQLHSMSPVGLVPSILVTGFLLVGSLILALPEASKPIFALLCLYLLAVSLPTLVEALLDEQASALYIYSSMPFIVRLGSSAQTSGQVIGFVSSSGNAVTMHVDSYCAGSSAFGVFLFLSGLVYLATRAGRKRTVLLISAGSMALYVLNVFRLVALVYIGYAFSAEAMWQAHSYIGYVLLLPFYAVYLLIFLRIVGRSKQDMNAMGSKKTVGAVYS